MARYRGRRRTRRRASRKKNLLPTKIPTSMGSLRYQWRQLATPSKAAVALIAAGAIGGGAAIKSASTLPLVGNYAAMFANMGAKLTKKV
jgi:hypothetical protein